MLGISIEDVFLVVPVGDALGYPIELIEEISVDLYEDCPMSEYGSYRDDKWIAKYCTGKYGENLQQCYKET